MANVSAVRTELETMQDGALNNLNSKVEYYGKLTFDASPAAQEIYLAGIKDHRFNLPENSYAFGMVVASAWNITDGDTPAGAVIFFGVENDGGTVAVTPTNIRATDGNEIVEFNAGVGTWVVDADDTNKAVVLKFTGTASKVYQVRATMYVALAGALMNFPNNYGTTT